MIKLSEYLDYLYREVIQARKLVDVQSVELAKEYSKNEYLKYFRVPRFTIPSVKLEIPIKINELDATTKYNFKMDEASYISDVNKRIEKVNREKKLNIQFITKETLHKHNFEAVTKELEKRDYRYVKRIDESINRIDFTERLGKLSTDLSSSVKDKSTYKKELDSILKFSLRNQFTPVSARLKNIFIDPDTSKEADKDKILIKLNVELVEEGLRIVKLKDEKGNEFEEIVFE